MAGRSTSADIDTTVPAVVLKLYHHCGLGAVRSLGRLGVPVHAVADGERLPAARSRYLRETLPLDIDTAEDAESVERLGGFAERIGGRPLLISTDDRGADFVADNAEALREWFRFPEQPAGLVGALGSKEGLHRLCLEHGVPTPGALFPKRREDVVDQLDSVRFPVVVKGIDGWRLQRRTGMRMAFAHDRRELLDLYDRLEDPDAPNLMLQEYIPGGAESVWMLNGYFDEASECLVAFTGRKLRQNPPHTGMTSLGVCLANPEVERLTKGFMKALGYRGILDLGYRYDERDGRYKLLDVNPRLGATFRLFVGTGGLDVLRAQYLDLTGQAVPSSQLRQGRRWLVEDYDVAASLRYRRDGELSARAWLGSLRGVRETAWLAADDPVPAAALVHDKVIRRMLTRAAGRGASA